MKKIYLFIALILSIAGIYIFLDKDKKNSPEEQFYKLSSRFYDSYSIQKDFYNNKKNMFVEDTVYCSVKENLQEKINESVGKTLILEEGIHRSYVLKVPSNIKIIVPLKSSIKLADDFSINQTVYGDAVGDAVVQCWGSKDKLLENIIIELNGTIDGNKLKHPYSKGGIEGVDFKWVTNSAIYGNGSIINANGDGLDIDVSKNCYFEGITLTGNDGGGVHFGSPRPIKSSFNNLIVGCKSLNNGFLHKRYGFDHSWPNINGVTYFNCIANDNYVNWAVKGSGALLLDCFSLYSNIPKKANMNQGLLYSDLYEVLEPSGTDSLKVEKTGYYLVNVRNISADLNYDFLVNGKKRSSTKLKSQNSMKSETSIFFLHKNDKLNVAYSDRNHIFNQKETLPIIRVTSLIDYQSFYPDNYWFKILKWKAKSSTPKFVSDIYSYFK